MKKLLTIIIILGIIFGGYYFFSNKNAQEITNTSSDAPGAEEGLRLYTLLPDMLITSPLTVVGEIPGTWYFEGSFPVILEDIDGNIIGTSVAQAQGDWMVTQPVRFSVSMNFTNPNNLNSGYLVFKKDNPSGLPEHDKSVMWPVRLK